MNYNNHRRLTLKKRTSGDKKNLDMKHRTFFFLLSSIVFIAIANAQYHEYQPGILISEKRDSLPYRQLNPLHIEKGEKYPL
ncbi:MAG TPA: hypothetical protein DDX07_07505, partial [Porphyromonadaceae bacterium]|nr:hypothetical protein [Porphyromonadaceae bacterium]